VAGLCGLGFILANVAAFGVGHFVVAHGAFVPESASPGPAPANRVAPRAADTALAHASLINGHTKMNRFPG
jgi:hypothetical protein